MGQKRFKGNAKKKKAPREEDAALRLTHLIAASTILSERAPSVSKFYARTSRQICRRVNLTLDSVSVKRLFCKKCNSTLLPGVGDPPATYRIASRRERHLVVKCGHCGFVKRYLARNPEQSMAKGKKVKTSNMEREVDDSHDKTTEPKPNEDLQLRAANRATLTRGQEVNPWFQWPSNNCKVQ